MHKISVLTAVFLFFAGSVFAQNEGSQVELYTAKQQQLRITAEDVRLVPDTKNGGYHLYVRKSPNVNSILLTETTKDPAGKNDSYAYRAKEYNSIKTAYDEENPQEYYDLRMLHNMFIPFSLGYGIYNIINPN